VARHTLDILDLAQGGEGVARVGGLVPRERGAAAPRLRPAGRASAQGERSSEEAARTVFVPFTAPGDRVVAELPEGPQVAHGRLLEVLSAGPARVAAPCPHFGPGDDARCGGCEWQHLAYAAQLAAKEAAFSATLRRIGKLEPGSYEARPILASPAPLRYRSRAKFHLDRSTSRLVFFRRRSHEAVQVRECHLLEAELDRLREEVGPALAAARLEPREVTLEWSRRDGRGAAFLQLAAVSASARRRAEALLAALPSLAGVVLGAEDAPVTVVGEPVLRHDRRPGEPAGGVQRSRPDVFQQANRGANALLVAAALDLLRPEGMDVLELYCGAGNFTGPLAARARSVHAVEVQGPSLELARADVAGAPGLAPTRFFAGDALAMARAFARESGPSARRFGAVLLDPPRDGARGIGAALRDLGAPSAVYVSCDPATFARDLRACVDAGYRVEVVQPVDMFPQTHHVEGIARVVKSARTTT
jgi:23S rRNA (uracil1939-C5)-methyltransferase